MIEIKFCSLSSGSSGNSYYVETDDTKILVDAGLTGKKTKELLENIGVDPSTLDGIFISHEHKDHISGAGVLSRRYDIPIFANSETWSAMENFLGKISSKNRREFDVSDNFYFKNLYVTPVPLFHDAVNPNGYVFQTDFAKLSVITDTGWVSNDMMDFIRDSNLYVLESNHDEKMLINGFYPWHLKQRILSTRGHLSNENCSKVLKELIKGHGEIVLLSHLSVDNNTQDLALGESKKILTEAGKDLTNGGVHLDVAPRYINSKLFDLRGER